MIATSLNATLNLSEAIGNFAAHADIQHALLLTYTFDGPYLEDTERGLLEILWRRNCENVLVLRDSKAVLAEKHSLRYRVVNVAHSTRVFHSKLILLMAEAEVMAIVGSANLTRGGLETNLETGHVYRLSRDAGPRVLFESLADYLDNGLRRELSKSSPQHQAVYDLLIRDLRRFLQDVPAHHSVEPIFLHNYAEPLLPQIARCLPGRCLDALWVVSPFFEPDHRPEDPNDEIDATLLGQIFDRQNFTPVQTDTSWVHLYFQTTGSNVTTLPVNLLEPYKSQIALYARDTAGLDRRTLHAKLLVFIGRTSMRRDASPFVVLVHGSANFTKAALLSVPPDGNAEIVVVTPLPRPAEVTRKLADYLNLPELFVQLHDWKGLQSKPAFTPPATTAVRIWECLVSVADQQVTLFFEVKNTNAQRVNVILCGDGHECSLGQAAAPFAPSITFDVPDGLFEPATEPGYRRLPYHSVRVDVFDAAGLTLGTGLGPLNVDCPEAFCEDWWCQPIDLRLDNQIYLAGLGRRANYEAMRKQVEHVSQSGSLLANTIPLPTHQADLDLFFRRIHTGLRGLRWRVEYARGSLYVLGDVLRQLARWTNQVVLDEPGDAAPAPFSIEQKLYLCDRLIQTAAECATITRKSADQERLVPTIVCEDFIEPVKTVVQQIDHWRHDPALSAFAQGSLNRWNQLTKAYEPQP